MKLFKKTCLLAILVCLLVPSIALADTITEEEIPGNYNPSILLEIEILSSKDSVHRYGRGEFLAEGAVEISNKGNGDIYICIDTYAYRNVDKIFHTVFLEYWSESDNDWIQEDYWEFEKTKEEAGGELSDLISSFTLIGYPTGRYYRVRGLHGVELNDEIEACATRTDGVLITKD